MAKRFRVDALKNGQDLKGLLDQYFKPELHNEILDAIEKTGAIPDELFAKANYNDTDKAKIKGLFGPVLQALPSPGQALGDFIGSIKDEANATDEELQNKLDAYKGIKAAGPPMDFEKVKAGIRDLFGSYGVDPQTLLVEKVLPEFVMRARRLPDAGEFRDEMIANGVHPSQAQHMLGYAPLMRMLYDQNAKNFVSLNLGQTGNDYEPDIKRVSDILETRGIYGTAEGVANNFLKTAPAELRSARNLYYQNAQDSNARYLRTRATPNILETLNTRGLAEGPDVQSAIAAAGGDLQAKLESQIRDLEASDNAIFADAAYRITQAKLDASEYSLRTQVAFERQKLRQDQEARFNQSQADAQGMFEKRLLNHQLQRELDSTQSGLDFSKDQQDASTIANLGGDLGSSVGNTIGAKIATSGAPATPSTTSGASAVPSSNPAPTRFDQIG